MRILKVTSEVIDDDNGAALNTTFLLIILPPTGISRTSEVWLTFGMKSNEPLPLATVEILLLTMISELALLIVNTCLTVAPVKSRGSAFWAFYQAWKYTVLITPGVK